MQDKKEERGKCTNKNNLHGQVEMSVIARVSKSLSVIKLVRLYNLNFTLLDLFPLVPLS